MFQAPRPHRFRWRARPASRLVACALALLGVFDGARVWAALGGDAASVQADQQAWGATAAQTALSGVTLQTQTLANGTTVRQYLDANGLVFAVAWEGPVLPDFVRLLGNQFASYQDALQVQRRGVSVHTAAVVIESGGMMRAFAGRAYLPANVPAGFGVPSIH